MKGKTVRIVSTLEDMVNLHNESVMGVTNELNKIVRQNKKTNFMVFVSLAGAAYSIQKIKELSDKLDRLKEDHANLKREYVRSQAGMEDRFE